MADETAPPRLDPIPHILTRGSLNLLAGASGIGKTALLSQLIRCFETGVPIFGHPINKPPAMGYIAADRSWRSNSHWFETSGVETLKKFSLIDDHSMKLPNQRMKHLRVQFFKDCVARLELPPGALLITDPIALFLGGNLLDYDTVGFACIEIQRWLQSSLTDYCTIGLCHAAKQKSDKHDRYLRLQDRISGSMAQLGYTSTQMFLAGPDETGDKDGRYTFLWNPHTAPAEVFQFEKGSNGLFLLDGAIRHGQAEVEAEESPDASPTMPEAIILTTFELTLLALFPPDGTPLSTHAILTQMATDAASRRRIFRGLERLAAKGELVKHRHGLWGRAMPLAATADQSPSDPTES